jgi:NADH-quinone oxidoreductase subunit C
MMTLEQLTAFVTEQVPEMKSGISKQYPEFIIPADKLHCLARVFKLHGYTKMDYLFCLTAADRKDGLHVIYHLTSSVLFHSVVLRVILPDKTNPAVPTVSDIWKAAEYYEREVFDLFGIRFENHPNLKRIFLEDDWIGYPLRKDYKDTFTLER